MIELLAITRDAEPPEPPLRMVRSGGLSAVCAPADGDHDLTPEALWRREAVLEELMETRDLLPVRFGTRVPDERAAERALAERRAEFTASLERVRGAVELALRVHVRDPGERDRHAHESGREYLRASTHRRRAARLMHEPLAIIARDTAVRPGREVLRAAYLVDRGAVDEFVAAVRRLQRDHPELALVCTGPWPPYSFAEGGITP